jgi:membrane-bound lytic murein transglycosylase B
VLAGIGAVETGHGSDVRRSPKGAVGPMQFLPSTFAVYGMDGDGDGRADVMNPADAVYSAARYLCLWGGGRGGQALYDAVWAYNHAVWYVRRVFAFANAYA